MIANRGEIACRIIRSARAMGIATVAVYSEADASALHVEMADEAYAIGPARAAESYLVIAGLLDAARESGADAVHPGYGFLAESADFAEAVAEAGLIWIGPDAACIRAMGDKQRARSIAVEAGVPVLPGSRRFTRAAPEGLKEAAEEIGYPLLIKAAGGGGGIGMQRVDSPDELVRKAASTQTMAEKVFGDDAIYLERLVESPRHVEVQVFGFGDGGGVHLFDRDCSVQRRYQKIIEEAPAPNVPEAVRQRMYEAALALVRQVRYRSLGTVEFLYDQENQAPYFLEMNTRIQVEHPVTEMITGKDLVAWQIEEARGEGPRPAQAEIQRNGVAIEARLYAERPEKNFMPSPGRIERLEIPEAEHLRVDCGMRSGDTMTPYYDPMVAKIAVWGEDRSSALERLNGVLRQTVVEGIHSNREFLAGICRNANFRAGRFSTRFVEDLRAESLKAAV
nr:biotin carboxylase N-terminal domain-containing protein [Afifella sp. IM 167]